MSSFKVWGIWKIEKWSLFNYWWYIDVKYKIKRCWTWTCGFVWVFHLFWSALLFSCPCFHSECLSFCQLTAKNIQCMRTLLNLAHCHGAVLGTSWQLVLATLQVHTHTQTCHKCLHLVCGYFFSTIHHQQHSLSVRPLLQIVVPHFHPPSNFSCCSTWSGSWGWSQGWVEPLSLAEPRRDPAQWVCPRFLTLWTSGFWSCSGWKP